MPNWEYYSKRRNINLAEFIVVNNVENYEQLVELCRRKGLEDAPEKASFQAAYAVAFPPPKPAPAPKPRATKKTQPATKKTTRRKSK